MFSPSLSNNEKRVIFLSSLGGVLEFYDFIIFIFFANTLSQLFFPQKNSITGLLEAFAVFAIGYLCRPLGGILFSHFGDKYGRKKPFVSTLMLMALPTFLIGLLPTNQTLGIWAAVLLTLLRVLQGLSLGGELSGSIVFATEHVNASARGLASGCVFFGINFGMALGSAVYALLIFVFPAQSFSLFGWRIAFILGGILGFVSYWLRKSMAETPAFIVMQKKLASRAFPLYSLFQHHWRTVIQGIALASLQGTIVVPFLYLPTYLTAILHYPKNTINLLNTANIILLSICAIGVGYVSDIIGRRLILLISSIGLIIFSYGLFYLLSLQHIQYVILVMIIFAVQSACITGACACTVVELFPTAVRYSGMAFSFNIGMAVFGGLAPLFSTYLIAKTHNVIAPSYYLIFCGIVALIAIIPLKDKHRQALTI